YQLYVQGRLPLRLTLGGLVVLDAAQRAQDRGYAPGDARDYAIDVAARFVDLLPAAAFPGGAAAGRLPPPPHPPPPPPLPPPTPPPQAPHSPQSLRVIHATPRPAADDRSRRSPQRLAITRDRRRARPRDRDRHGRVRLPAPLHPRRPGRGRRRCPGVGSIMRP